MTLTRKRRLSRGGGRSGRSGALGGRPLHPPRKRSRPLPTAARASHNRRSVATNLRNVVILRVSFEEIRDQFTAVGSSDTLPRMVSSLERLSSLAEGQRRISEVREQQRSIRRLLAKVQRADKKAIHSTTAIETSLEDIIATATTTFTISAARFVEYGEEYKATEDQSQTERSITAGLMACLDGVTVDNDDLASLKRSVQALRKEVKAYMKAVQSLLTKRNKLQAKLDALEDDILSYAQTSAPSQPLTSTERSRRQRQNEQDRLHRLTAKIRLLFRKVRALHPNASVTEYARLIHTTGVVTGKL